MAMMPMPTTSTWDAPIKVLATFTVAEVTNANAAMRNMAWWKSTGIRSVSAIARQIQREYVGFPLLRAGNVTPKSAEFGAKSKAPYIARQRPQQILVRPLLGKDPREHRPRAAHAIRRLVRVSTECLHRPRHKS